MDARAARVPTGQRRSTVEEQVTLEGGGRAPSDERLLLDGLPGREGFLFHDTYRSVHQAAPGLLGLVEARPAMERWKPGIVRWLDGTEHFFNHLFTEFRGQRGFGPIRQELEGIARLSTSWEARNACLFSYLTAVSRELEQRERIRRARGRHCLRVTDGSVPQSLSLNGTWTAHYRLSEGKYVDREMSLPVNWELVSGISNYAGSMRFTRVVWLAPALRGRRLALRFHGVDYFADVWVNGHHAGGHEGYFAPFELDISSYVHLGEDNLIRVTVTSPNDPSCEGTHVNSGWDSFAPGTFPNRKTMVKGTLGHHDARRGGAWNCLTSQDGNTGGIWNDVELRIGSPVRFEVMGVRVLTDSLSAQPTSDESVTDPRSSPPPSDECTAAVRINLSIRNGIELPVDAQVRVDIEPANFEGASFDLHREVRLMPGLNEVALSEELAPVRPWEPRDHGFPHLYTVTSLVEIEGGWQDRHDMETGFRTLPVTPLGESDAANGAFIVNGRRVFVRGVNLLPTYWLSEYTAERIERDVELLLEGGFNGVMMHALIAPRRFYEQANRSGLLVLQMFPLQWSYEESPEFTERASVQLREMTALLHNEPSVVSYEVHNEPDMRTAPDLDNRRMDFALHSLLRETDPHRWATTFSGANHAYPGQFYRLRDDNSFQTLPARYDVERFDGQTIARHRNMPTEFGLQAMPHAELFAELMSEQRVKAVLRRIRTDPGWLAAGGDTWQEAETTMEAAKSVLGAGSWRAALQALDWRHLWELGTLTAQLAQLEQRHARRRIAGAERERLSLRLALLLLDVLHYGAFKGENFWFGLWRPGPGLEEFVASGQNRQYRIHKDAIEMYLNASVVGPITGYFSFMFRDADWQAPTWGIVDAAWVPKKAFRAYRESNHPVRVTLPGALVGSVRLPGDPWMSAAREDRGELDKPWVAAEMIVANDTSRALSGVRVTVWVDDGNGTPMPVTDRSGGPRREYELTLDLPACGGWSALDGLPLQDGTSPSQWIVAEETAAGCYYVRARVSSAEGEELSTNSYEIHVLDTAFPELSDLTREEVTGLLEGERGRDGFHFWQGAHLLHRARPGMRGLLEGFREAQARGGDLYEVIQGEHLFRHILEELRGAPYAEPWREEISHIRSEVISPAEKSRLLLRYLEFVTRRAQERLDDSTSRRSPARRHPTARRRWAAATAAAEARPGRRMRAAGRDQDLSPERHSAGRAARPPRGGHP